MASETFGDATTFFIGESTDGDFGNLMTTVSLAGRALPARPFELTGTMRAETTWYPGSPVASLQMLGSKEEETTINGWWKDRFISPTAFNGATINPDGVALINGAQVASVSDLASEIDGIRSRGQLLEVTWSDLTRYGYLRTFHQKWHNVHDLEWEVTFEWISREIPVAPPGLPPTIQPQDLVSQFLNAETDLLSSSGISPRLPLSPTLLQIAAAITAPFEMAADFQAGLADNLFQISAAVTGLTNAALNNVNGAVTQAQQAVQMISDIGNAAKGALAIVESLDARTVQSLINQADPQLLSFGQVLAAAAYARGLKNSANSMASLAYDQGTTLFQQTYQTAVLATFIARQNTDLRDVSTQFYGSQDQWHQIAEYNDIDGSGLNAGQLIFIPNLSSGGGT